MTELAQSDPYETCKRVQFRGSHLHSADCEKREWSEVMKSAGWSQNTSVTGALLVRARRHALSSSTDSFHEAAAGSQSIVGRSFELFPVKMWCHLKKVQSVHFRIASEYTSSFEFSFCHTKKKSQSVDKQIWKCWKQVGDVNCYSSGWSRNSLCLNLKNKIKNHESVICNHYTGVVCYFYETGKGKTIWRKRTAHYRI